MGGQHAHARKAHPTGAYLCLIPCVAYLLFLGWCVLKSAPAGMCIIATIKGVKLQVHKLNTHYCMHTGRRGPGPCVYQDRADAVHTSGFHAPCVPGGAVPSARQCAPLLYYGSTPGVYAWCVCVCTLYSPTAGQRAQFLCYYGARQVCMRVYVLHHEGRSVCVCELF